MRPVDLALGRLAATLGDDDVAHKHLTAARSTCEALHALTFQALTLAEFAALGDKAAAGRARSLASRLGRAPLLTRLEVVHGHPLTRREAEIAALVGRRSEQRCHWAAAEAVGADGRESRQPHSAQARADLPSRHRFVARTLSLARASRALSLSLSFLAFRVCDEG